MFQFDADNNATEDGVWTDFQGSRFKVAHLSNMRFQRALTRLQAPHRRAIERGSLDPKTQKELTCKAMAEGVLLDWEGVGSKKASGTVKYTPEAGFAALMGNTEFRDFVSDFAMNLANFRQEEVEDMGNA